MTLKNAPLDILQLCVRLATILVLLKKDYCQKPLKKLVLEKIPRPPCPSLPRGSSLGQALLQGCLDRSPRNAQIIGMSQIFAHNFFLLKSHRNYSRILTQCIFLHWKYFKNSSNLDVGLYNLAEEGELLGRD